GEPDPLHGRLEQRAVLGLPDRVELGADQLDPEALEGAVFGERDREVQPGLAAERRQQRLRPLALDDLRDDLGGQRLQVGPRRGFFALVEYLVDAPATDPGDLAVAPELLAEHAHALVDSLPDRLGLEPSVVLGGERRPFGLLPRLLGLPIGHEILRYTLDQPPSPRISAVKRLNR